MKKKYEIEILSAEHPIDLRMKIKKRLNNKDINIISIEYAIAKGIFSVLILFTES